MISKIILGIIWAALLITALLNPQTFATPAVAGILPLVAGTYAAYRKCDLPLVWTLCTYVAGFVLTIFPGLFLAQLIGPAATWIVAFSATSLYALREISRNYQ